MSGSAPCDDGKPESSWGENESSNFGRLRGTHERHDAVHTTNNELLPLEMETRIDIPYYIQSTPTQSSLDERSWDTMHPALTYGPESSNAPDTYRWPSGQIFSPVDTNANGYYPGSQSNMSSLVGYRSNSYIDDRSNSYPTRTSNSDGRSNVHHPRQSLGDMVDTSRQVQEPVTQPPVGQGSNAHESTTQIEAEVDAPKVSCQVCGQEFHGDYARGNLTRHRKTKHSDIVYFCEVGSCTRNFHRIDYRKNHWRKDHPEKNL